MLTIATALVRAWTRLYTWRVSAGARASRRAEIESDLWESQDHSRLTTSPWRAGLQMIARLVIGVPDDLAWYFEQAPRRRVGGKRLFASAYLGAAAIGGLCALFLFAHSERERPIPAAPTHQDQLRLMAPLPYEGKLMLMPPPPPPRLSQPMSRRPIRPTSP